jgi:murein DD-endopeptidase MepM/ murein hydrolase activator NlpD
MAFNLENMTVDYKTMYRMVPSDRFKVAQSGAISDLISSLTPGQLVNLFPRYYRDRLPDIGTTTSLGGALSGGSSYRPNQSTSYGPTPSPVVKKQLTPEEKAVQELFQKAKVGGIELTGSTREKAASLTERMVNDLGISQTKAAAIVGNFMHESGDFQQMQEISPTSGRGGYGWAQWTGPRRKNFEEFVAARGMDINSDDANYQFFLHEIQNDPYERQQFERWKNTDYGDLASETVAFEGSYERAGVKHHGSRIQRAETALQMYEQRVSEIESNVDSIKDLSTVQPRFDSSMISMLDDRLQKWYQNANETQKKNFEEALGKLGPDQFNETMKRQPVNSATIMAAPGTPLMLPVGGSMAGRSITSGDDVPFSGGAPGSRSFGGPRGTNQLHTGVDIPGNPGDPVIAVDNGIVVGMRKSPSGYGYILDVQYPDGTVHRMAHLGVNNGGEESAYAEGLKVGDAVSAGQRIGTLGYSGNAGAEFPHVHYEVIRQDYYEQTHGSPPGRISGRGDAAENQLEAGRIDPREWYAKRQEEYLKQQEAALVSDPVTAAQSNMAPSTPPTAQLPPVEIPPAVAAPGLSAGGTVPMTPGENIAGINTTTGKVEFMSNDRELYTKDDQGNLRVDPSTIRQDEQPAPPVQETQRPEPVQPLQSKPQQPMPVSTPDPDFLETMSSGSMASSPSQLRALNRAKLYSENSSGLVNGHFS